MGEAVGDLLRRALSTFDGGTPPADREERRERMVEVEVDAFDELDTAFYSLLEELYERLARYVDAHPQEFFRTQ